MIVNIRKWNFVLISICSLFFIFSACTTTKQSKFISPNSFYGNSFIKKGDTAKLSWDFMNASNVYIENFNRNYFPIDSIEVYPNIKTTYNFKVSNETDTLLYSWNVFIEGENNKITTGPPSLSNEPSYIQSDYLSGIINYSNTSNVSKIKIIKTDYPFEQKNVIRYNAILLDEFGNFISGIDSPGSSTHFWNGLNYCSDGESNEIVSSEKEINVTDTVFCDILLDNSALSTDYFPIIDQVKDFLNFDKNKSIGLKLFNQTLIEKIPILPDENKFDKLRNIKLSKFVGFSSIFKYMYHSISELSELNGNNKICILIAYSSDNSSLVYDRNDVIRLAKKNKIPVYIIGIGNSVDSYSFQNICSNSGGRFYQINDDDLPKIKNILNEIYSSQKNYYQLDVSVSSDLTNKCKSFTNKLLFASTKGNIYDSTVFKQFAEPQIFKYQAIASFDFKDTVLTSDFDSQIKEISDILKDNPSKTIELVGNASIEGNEEFTNKISLKRAQIVRAAILKNGVNPKQVRVRGDGSNNPIYYIQENNWTQYYNRRVEVRWLDPDLLPFEIIASQHKTESEALSNVEQWENQGFKTYFERYLQNNYPIYRVKIWGFRTLDEAQKEAATLSKTFKQEFYIQ